MEEPYFRPNVGMVVLGPQGRVFWGERCKQVGIWQFPQGGMQSGEAPIDAVFRELYEELGLLPAHIELLGCTREWYCYEFPADVRRPRDAPHAVGQKQKWWLLRLRGDDTDIVLDATDSPEFKQWKWVPYWYPIYGAVGFKRAIYQKILVELRDCLHHG